MGIISKPRAAKHRMTRDCAHIARYAISHKAAPQKRRTPNSAAGTESGVSRGRWRVRFRHLTRRFAIAGVLQNDAAPTIIDKPPFFDLLQGSKAAQAGEVVGQAAIADARGLNCDLGITHGSAQLQGFD